MSGGRWDPQTRVAVVVVGMLVVTIGALSTVQWQSGIGAAALVIGGLLVGLAGVAGGTIFGPRDIPEIRIISDQQSPIPTVLNLEATPTRESVAPSLAHSSVGHPPVVGPVVGHSPVGHSPVGHSPIGNPTVGHSPISSPTITPIPTPWGPRASQAHQSSHIHELGDIESATKAMIQQLRTTAPQAVEYHEMVCGIITEALGERSLCPATGHPLGPFLIVGLCLAVDIRAGTGFSTTMMKETYQTIINNSPEITAILVVVNTNDTAITDAISRLHETLAISSLVAVPWRPTDPPHRVVDGAKRALRMGHTASSGSSGSSPPDIPIVEVPSALTQSALPKSNTPPTGPEDDMTILSDMKDSSNDVTHTRTATLPPPQPDQRDDQPSPHSDETPHNSSTSYDDSVAWRYASDLHWRGQLQEAEGAYRKIVEERARAHGWDHPDTLTARDQHATVLRDLDRLAEALVECDEVFNARARVLGKNHPDTLTSHSHLATIYHQLGDLTRAESEHRKVLDIRISALGDHHAETLISRSQLAKVYQDLGELDKSICEHETVMRERAEIFGPDHRDTLMSRSLLASALHQAGRLTEAERQHRDVLRTRLRELGPQHLDTAVSRHRLASVLHDLHRLSEAIDEYRGAKEIYAALLGASNPFTRAAISDLASAERALRTTSANRRSDTNQ